MPDIDSYTHVVEGAGAWDRTAEGRLEVRGADRRTWLHGLVTNDIERLRPGEGCYAALLTAQGRMITDMRVLETGDALLVDLPAGSTASLLPRLDSFVIAEDVELADRTGDLARITVAGARAASAITQACALDAAAGTTVSGFPPNHHRAFAFDGTTIRIAGSRDVGLVGWDLYVPVDARAALEDRLRAAGVVWPDALVHDTLRIEAGIPRFGIDMDSHTIPLEAGIDEEAISFTKGCYVGQEVIVRVMHRGHGRVARRLVGLLFAPDAPLVSREAPVSHQGESVGRITSATWSPLVGRHIGLGYVHRDHVAPGTEVDVGHEGAQVRATVAALPFGRR